MPNPLEPAAVAVRLRRMWLGEAVGSTQLAESDLQDAALDVALRRVGSTLIVSTPYDFGTGDPFDGALGDLVRGRAEQLSVGAVTDVTWEFNPKQKATRRTKASDLDIYSPGDPLLGEYPAILAKLRDQLPTTTPPTAREAIGALRLVGASEHRLWFAAPSAKARGALGTVPGGRAALVTAIQAIQKHEVPLYRVVIDASYRAKKALL